MATGIPTILQVAVDQQIDLGPGGDSFYLLCARHLTSLLQELVASSRNILTICAQCSVAYGAEIDCFIFNLVQLPRLHVKYIFFQLNL